MTENDEWWIEREKTIEKTYTENPTFDDYLLTIEVRVPMSPENDGIYDEKDMRAWLEHNGDFSSEIERNHFEIIKVKKVR